MKPFKIFLLLFISVFSTSLVSGQQNIHPDCEAVLQQKLDFLLDGSLQDEQALRREIKKLKPCGIDDFDIKFFGRLESLTSMLRKLTKDNTLEKLTFGDLYGEINKLKNTQGYQELKKIDQLSEELAQRTGNLANWSADVQIFEELGASRRVISEVFEYLETHPNNDKTYKEILETIQE
ncbi:hypothetical protein [Nonlabens xiamenensis]|uniref:hypothetical protein n=1 Tax=Nonlabens xiamenensis TaxID=2341043 RepID=UPI000F60DE09|nr:hypothetical protein [Nonlabens xiamenensis]